MSPEAYESVKKTLDGRGVVTLMCDPDPEHLSLVDRGANGRRVTVAKADELGGALDPGETVLDLRQPNGTAPGFWGKLWSGLFGSVMKRLSPAAPEPTKKGDDPTSFDAAVAVTNLRRGLWDGTDSLISVIWNIFEDEAITDKIGAIRVSLDQFKDYVIGLATMSQVAKLDDAEIRTAVAKAARICVQKEGKVLSKSNRTLLQNAIDALQALMAAAEPTTAQKAETATEPAEEAPVLKPADIQILADNAAVSAVKAAKAAGITDVSKLAEIGSRASTEVFKMAVSGVPQPGMPQNALAEQRAQAGGENGSMGAPEAMFGAQINSLSDRVSKLAELLEGKVAADGKVEQPGVVHVLKGIAQRTADQDARVKKLEGTPAQPRGGAEQPAPTDPGAVRTQKGAAAAWEEAPFLKFGG